MSQATASNHSNVFTSTLPLSEGREGEAWEPSDKTMLFLNLPQSVRHLTAFPFTYFSAVLSYLCLSLL
jgi:hypothetical protein